MKTLIVATSVALLLATPMALAASTSSTAGTSSTKPGVHRVATTTLSNQCTALGQRFDKAEAAHKNNSNYKEAVALDAEGKSLCSTSKQAAGVEYLHSAIKMIGVKAQS